MNVNTYITYNNNKYCNFLISKPILIAMMCVPCHMLSDVSYPENHCILLLCTIADFARWLWTWNEEEHDSISLTARSSCFSFCTTFQDDFT